MESHRTIIVADHHKSVFVCQILDRETGEVRRESLASKREILELFLSDLAGPVLVFVEACRAWEWVSDLCEDLGHGFRLVNPRQMPEIAKSTKKSDRADVEAMARRLLVEGVFRSPTEPRGPSVRCAPCPAGCPICARSTAGSW